jgi:F-type H+-transporting ATPase subunit a
VRRVFATLVWAVVAGMLVGSAWADHPPKDAPHEKEQHAKPADHATADAAKAPAHEHEPDAIEHVTDTTDWDFFEAFHVHWQLPSIFGFQITKFMILELIAAGAICAIYIPLARRLEGGDPPRGAWDNVFESFLTFIRNEVARPNLGDDADRFVPLLWTLFLYILFNNLLGMFPFGGSPTASIFVTGAMALIVFFAIHGGAAVKMGLGHYLATFWPHVDVPFPLNLFIVPLLAVIELIGILVRNAVLAVRLFANMFAGHMVLATILIFIYAARNTSTGLWCVITLSSVLGILALSLLELFIAFLQAYIFVFLASLFIGLAMHPEH